MTELFLKLVNMSISASWVVLAVVVLRLVLKKAPKWLTCSLWILVAFRLICPFSFESALSLIPEHITADTVADAFFDGYVAPVHIYWDITPEYEAAVNAGREPISGGEGSYYVVTGEDSISEPLTTKTVLIPVFSKVWLAGMLVLLGYAAVSYLRLKRKVAPSICMSETIRICDYIDTPFILGIMKPKIYLPSSLLPESAEYVLAHEKAHLRRRDHWWKPLGYLLLSVYWFHPLMWVAYILLCRDIELACDERVIKEMGQSEKKAYSAALLQCSVPRHMIAACPLAFGEVGIKDRVKSVLNYKKPAFWIIVIAVILCVVVAVCFLTDPMDTELESPFGKYYQASACIYDGGYGEISWDEDALYRTMFLTEKQTLIAILGHIENRTFDTIATFTEFSLTEENFDAYFSERGILTGYPSAKKLRENIVHAWEFHENSSSILSHDFYYLLQQKNGDLYLVYGNSWDAQYKSGNTKLYWIYGINEIINDDPYDTDAKTPHQWSRNLRTEDVEQVSLTAYDDSGVPSSFVLDEILQSELLWYLNQLPEKAFVKGSGVGELEVATYLSCMDGEGWDETLDILLRYGDGKVDMVFHSEAPWQYADLDGKHWEIRDEALIEFFARYSQMNKENHPFFDLDNPYHFAQNIKASHIFTTHVDVIDPEYTDGAYSLSSSQLDTLTSMLNKLPEDAFVPTATAPIDETVSAVLFSCYDMDSSDRSAYYADFLYFEDTVYLFIYTDDTFGEAAWIIQDQALADFIERLFDPSLTTVRIGEVENEVVSYSYLYTNMTLVKQDGWEYEIVEYTDDETPFGIRFRPKRADSGWLFLQFYPNGFYPPYEEMDTYSLYYGEQRKKSTIYTYKGRDIWAYEHYTWLPGTYVLMNEDADAWLPEYELDIDRIILVENLAVDIIKAGQALEIANEISDSDQNDFRASFDWKSGIWTVSQETPDSGPNAVLSIDSAGNILSAEAKP